MIKINKIAVLIPCYNEEKTIQKVITEFKEVLSKNTVIYVYDNNSTDKTATKARELGVVVREASVQGKGATVRKMLAEIDADVYLLVDGDDTYNPKYANTLIECVASGKCDMAIADRLSINYKNVNNRVLHNFGNRLVCRLINRKYKSNITDVMTGYRAFSKDFIKEFKIIFNGFELETEMTIFALRNNKNIISIPIIYRARPKGSVSKLNTIVDGIKILQSIKML